MAIGRRRKTMAVDADRHHGRNFSPGITSGAVRSIRAGCRERAAGATGIAIPLLRLLFQPPKLGFGLLALPGVLPPAYSPAICSLCRLPPSIPSTFVASRAM